MTPEELLKPRYKVIGGYPGNRFEIGEVFTCRGDGTAASEINMTIESNLSQFPHLFKKLEWWEDREEKDMPEYVMESKLNGIVAKVKRHFSDSKGENNKTGCQLDILTDWNYFSYRIWQPSTKEQYEQYQSKRALA